MTYCTGLSVIALRSATSARAAAGVISESMTIASVSVRMIGELAPTVIVPDAVA